MSDVQNFREFMWEKEAGSQKVSNCQIHDCRNLVTKCADCGRVVNRITIPMIEREWIVFEIRQFDPFESPKPPYDGRAFIACIWGQQVGQAIYARHHDGKDRCPGKYEFFYFSQDPEHEGMEIKIEDRPFPITHWMPLPEPPNEDK